MSRGRSRAISEDKGRPEAKGAEIRVYRHTSTDNFSVYSNALVRNRTGVKLSSVARCVLCHLLSLPPGWKTNRERLAEDFTEGRDKVGKAINELREHGFLSRKLENDPETGQLVWIWDVSDLPGIFDDFADDDAEDSAAPVDNSENPRSDPSTENQSMGSTCGFVDTAEDPVAEDNGLVNKTDANKTAGRTHRLKTPCTAFSVDGVLIDENRLNEGMTGASAPTPEKPAEWARQLVAELNYGRHRRPTIEQAAELASLMCAAHDDHGLSVPEIRKHARKALDDARKSGVPYLQGALKPDRLPVPAPTNAEAAPPVDGFLSPKAQAASDSKREAVMAQVRAKLPNKVQSRVRNAGRIAPVSDSRAPGVHDPATG
jgi:predicted transcriptional regulator